MPVHDYRRPSLTAQPVSAIRQRSTETDDTLLKTFDGIDVGGGQGRNRTTDTRIFSPLLYRLSYLAMDGVGG